MRELDRRTGDGLEVRLLWREGSKNVMVDVSDERTDDSFALVVPGPRARDAFQHPYAYRRPEREDERAPELV